MTTLQFDVPLFAEPVFYNLAMPTDYERRYHFVASEILHRGHSEVFRGDLSYDKFPEGIVVICKLIRGNLTRLKREAKFYCEQLKPLQGTHVPFFRGLYLGRHIEDEVDMPIGCIILQDCGSRITEKAIRKMGAISRSPQAKVRTLKALVAIHRAGVQHNAFYDDDLRHVVLSPEDPLTIRIVDFDDATPHDCKGKPIKIWSYEPTPWSFGCGELYDVSYALGAWTPVRFTFLSRDYSIFRAAPLGRLALLAEYNGNRDDPTGEARQYYWRKARECFNIYYKAYGTRFASIGHPLEFNEPLGLEGFEEPPAVEFGGVPPWETQEWIEHRERMRKDESKRLPTL